MILQHLTVRNFCLFRGKQALNLAPARKNGARRPIVLIGGMNGGGKTTLFDAIQLALYGSRARCSKRSQLSYDDFLKALEQRAEQLWRGQFAREDSQRLLQLAGQTRETMQEFLQRATGRKIDRLSGLITEAFRFILRKTTLVERILIDPTTFAVTLYDADGQALPRQRLSEGEKQLFAISMLWGLARAAARPMPAVIDTPMAHLDSVHRQHLVQRYFPNASHQVVILSTDTEVDREYYELLQPALARAYHLSYDESSKVTVAEEGYFWKQ
jgi:DNA sulfur modification protein DndD